jgi:hypothetical protein
MLACIRPCVGQNMIKLALRLVSVMRGAHTPTADSCIARARDMLSLEWVCAYIRTTVTDASRRAKHRRL